MNVCVVGTGYVGLVVAAVLADLGIRSGGWRPISIDWAS